MVESGHFLIRALLADGLVPQAEAERAQKHADAKGMGLLDALVDLGIISTRTLALAQAKICEYPFVDLAMFEVDIRNAEALPRAVSERLGAFPLFRHEGLATIGMIDPLNLQAIDQVRQHLKVEIDPVLCDRAQLRDLITRAYSLAGSTPHAASDAKAADRELTTGDEPIVAAVNQILHGGADARASDIHVSPDDNEMHLRYRIDGVLRRVQGPPISAHAGIVQRLKVMADLDLTLTRKPQDGKIRFVHKGEAVDIRVSILPTVYGENVVLRLLRSATKIGSIQDLGMLPEMAAHYEDAIRRPHGMVLVTGPTGSGKTTTLYTAVAALNTPDRNVVTIEDPVEIRFPMVRQVQVHTDIGLTFAAVLRSVLRHDPNVVLVGEIRDQETARIAMQAAMTGHLVLSTLHTNDAVGAIPRFRDFGIPAFGINQALVCVIAQRLVRRVCEACARRDEVDSGVIAELGLLPTEAAGLMRGQGCPRCMTTGYHGRTGVYEMLRITSRVQRLIEREAPTHEIEAAATADGMRRLWFDGLEKVKQGLTTVSELAKLRSTIQGDALDEPMRMSA